MKRTLILLGAFLIYSSLKIEKAVPDTKPDIHSTGAASDSIFIASGLLGCPTDRSVRVNFIAGYDLEIYFEYGTESLNYTNITDVGLFPDGEPGEVIIGPLSPDTRYYYRMRYRQSGASEFDAGDECSFHTQRPPGSSFCFDVEADPHLDEQSDPEIFKLALQNILADNPDFLIDLGDTFMSDKLAVKNYNEVVNRHLLFRSYFDRICHSIPLFLVLGNHEGESGWNLNGTSENLAVWTTSARKLYYPNPEPDHFYSGNSVIEDFVGLRENYYAFEWGDALFVILDPYWYTATKPGKSGDNWDWTLGEHQYRWFMQTLENSHTAFKFVFCHHLVGGKNTEARGGIEYAKYYEQGGLNEDGSWGFDEKRPGWGKPIQQLMVENNVTIFFHGHDHFFAKQNLDGVVYQLVPQPSHPNYTQVNQAINYGYISGDILPNSGHLRVTVSDSMVTVAYIRAYLPANENPDAGRVNGKADYIYTIPAGNTSKLDINETKKSPLGYKLYQNYPNPFNPVTDISYYLAHPDLVTLKIFDASGREAAVLANKKEEPGYHSIQFDGSGFSSGVYFYTFSVGNLSETKKLILIR